MKSVGEKIWAIPNPARIHSPDPFLRAVQEPRQSEKTFFPRKIDFRFAESVLKPHALPRNFLGRTPKEKHPFLFQEKIHPRENQKKQGVFFLSGLLAYSPVCGASVHSFSFRSKKVRAKCIITAPEYEKINYSHCVYHNFGACLLAHFAVFHR